MKFLQKLFDRTRPHFEADGKFHLMKPLFDAMDNFAFAPSTRTAMAPHIRDPLDVKRFMSMVIIGLLPAVVASFYFFGWRVLPMIIVSYAAGGAVEVIFAVIRKEEINEGFLVTGLLFPLVLPPTLPLWMVAVGVVFGVVVGKEVFGGTGRNLFNPALVGRCFLALAYPKAMAASWIEPGVDAVTSATPLVVAKQGTAELAGYAELFFGNVAGCIGETSALALIVGGIFLLFTRVANWRTVVSALVAFAVAAAAFNLAQPDKFAPAQWHLLAGGLLLGVFFMATDPVSSPMTNGGKWAYGALIGVITILIRNLTGYVEGMMFAILLGNIVAPILDEIVINARLRRLRSER